MNNVFAEKSDKIRRYAQISFDIALSLLIIDGLGFVTHAAGFSFYGINGFAELTGSMSIFFGLALILDQRSKRLAFASKNHEVLNHTHMYHRLQRSANQRKIFTVLHYAAAGIVLLNGFFIGIPLFDTFLGMFLYGGIGLLSYFGYRRAMKEAMRLSELNIDPDTQQNISTSTRQKEDSQKRALNENISQNLSVLEQGEAFAHEINKANELIPDKEVTDDLNDICNYINDIFIQASKNRSSERQIRKFANIYLPQTLKLSNLYIDLDAKRMQTESVKELKSQIAKSIANAKKRFCEF